MSRKPVMVAATEFRDGATGTGLVEGFRQLGWLIQTVDQRAFTGSTRSLVHRVATKLTRNALRSAYREAVWRECDALRPEVFFTVKGTGLDSQLLKRIRALGTKTVMYYPDFHFGYAGVDQDSFIFYDLFVTTKSFQLEWLRERLGERRTAYVPHGYTPEVFQPVCDSMPGPDYLFDVLYMGNHSPNKQHWLERLLELNPDLKLGVVGNRWREQKSPLKIARSSLLGEVRGLSLAKIIQSSRVNIALHFGKSDFGWEDLVSTRTFEIPACKGFMLHIDNPEIRDLFNIGKEIDVFSSPESLHEKIQYYLAHPNQRSNMIEHAFARAVPAYGYGCRAAEIDRLIRHMDGVEEIPR